MEAKPPPAFFVAPTGKHDPALAPPATSSCGEQFHADALSIIPILSRDLRTMPGRKRLPLADALLDVAAKPAEFSTEPQPGQTVEPPHPMVGGSMLMELNASQKVGSGNPPTSLNPTNFSLDRIRVDSSGRPLTTNQAVTCSIPVSSIMISKAYRILEG